MMVKLSPEQCWFDAGVGVDRGMCACMTFRQSGALLMRHAPLLEMNKMTGPALPTQDSKFDPWWSEGQARYHNIKS